MRPQALPTFALVPALMAVLAASVGAAEGFTDYQLARTCPT